MLDSISQVDRISVSSPFIKSINSQGNGELFSAMLKDAASSSIDVVKGSERMAISGLTGNTSITDVVHNVMAAERSFHTILAIRDKAVSAYQEISRLQI